MSKLRQKNIACRKTLWVLPKVTMSFTESHYEYYRKSLWVLKYQSETRPYTGTFSSDQSSTLLSLLPIKSIWKTGPFNSNLQSSLRSTQNFLGFSDAWKLPLSPFFQGGGQSAYANKKKIPHAWANRQGVISLARIVGFLWQHNIRGTYIYMACRAGDALNSGLTASHVQILI